MRKMFFALLVFAAGGCSLISDFNSYGFSSAHDGGAQLVDDGGTVHELDAGGGAAGAAGASELDAGGAAGGGGAAGTGGAAGGGAGTSGGCAKGYVMCFGQCVPFC